MSRRNHRLKLSIFEGAFDSRRYKPEITHKRRRLSLIIVLFHRDEVVIFIVHKRENVFGRPCQCVVGSNI